MLDTLRGLYVFAHVAETLSFSRAAEKLSITKSAVSRWRSWRSSWASS